MLTGGRAYSQAEAAALIGKAIGKAVRYVDVPADAMEKNLLGAGMPAWFVKDLLALMLFYRTGAAAEVTPTVQEITRKPPRSFEDFVRDYASAFKG